MQGAVPYKDLTLVNSHLHLCAVLLSLSLLMDWLFLLTALQARLGKFQIYGRIHTE